ncbi:MAG: MBL fold metallo-hydrolase [Gammaproteobacteria bacterium]|nr:MAG: MBL fold metallo-hydrolase [Gammaproteobacteria bacterium]
MRITFLGGTETVTGSKFLVETETRRVLVDCGLFQGYKWLRERNWQAPPLDIAALDAVILTHAHLDHSGYIPVLYKHGFRGPVYTHHATKALCHILLADSGHIQEEDAKYYARHKLGKHAHPEPLYDRATAEASMALFEAVDFDETITVGDISFYLQPAGHILGAASIILEAGGKRVGFSGDVGRSDDILMRPPRPLPELDLLLLESTYGDRRHEGQDPFAQLADLVTSTAQKGGVVLIPAFAVGRAQALQYMLTSLIAKGDIPKMPIYLDSPMAISVSAIFCQYSEQHKLTEEQCQFMCEGVTYTRSVDESKAIAGQAFPHIIIAGSGMATGGRILHHFKRLLGKSKTTVLFTGYQAGGTRGAKMLKGVDAVKIHGKWIPARAKVEVISGLSGHADYLELTQWLKQSALKPSTAIQLIHGDPDALEGLRTHLQEHTTFSVDVAGYRNILRL